MSALRTFEAAGGVHLATERWVPAGAVRAHVVYVHGLGEHRRARPYLPFFGKLAANGSPQLVVEGLVLGMRASSV